MIVIQSVLTAALAICIAVNAIIVTCKENPHTKKRKELEKQREADLTPLGARNSLLGDPLLHRGAGPDGKGRYSKTGGVFPLNQITPQHLRNESFGSTSGRGLVDSAAPIGLYDDSHQPHQLGERY